MGKIPRQPAESLRVLAQISYLSLSSNVIFVSLSRDDARDIFDQLSPLPGTPLADGNEEIKRRTDQFVAATAEFELDYVSSAISDVEDAGFSSTTSFAEGAKSRKTHLVIERNGKIREAFFKANPSAVCDFCGMDTGGSYPWTNRILDVHHLLPLCSGARTSKQGTLLDDLVAVSAPRATGAFTGITTDGSKMRGRRTLWTQAKRKPSTANATSWVELTGSHLRARQRR